MPKPRGSRPSIATLTKAVGKERERHRRANRALGLVLASGDGLDGLARLCLQFFQPAMSIAKRVNEDRARLGSHGPNGGGWFAVPLDDLASSIGRWWGRS
jgi:hypothetical protein